LPLRRATRRGIPIPELLAQNALVEAVARIEQQVHADAVVDVNLDRMDPAHFIAIGDGGDRTPLRLQHDDLHAGAVGQDRRASAAAGTG
jgi:hypothetical protein